MIELQKFATNFRDTIMKVLGIMTSVMYLMNGQMFLGQSIIKGPFMGAVKAVGSMLVFIPRHQLN